MNEGFSAADLFDRNIKHWWVIFVCMLLGAGIGWLVHQAKAPIYEAKSTITTAINYAETGYMTDLEEDHALSTIGDVINSDIVLTALKSTLDEPTLMNIGGDLRDHLFAEREGYRWTLRVQAPSAVMATKVSEAWAEAALAALNDSLDHANLALILNRQISEMQTCFTQSVSQVPSAAPCELADSSRLRENLTDLGEQYRAEQNLSNGIIPALVFSLTQAGEKSGDPVTYKTSGLVLAGAMIGFISGVILVIAGIPKRVFKASLRGK